VYLLKNADIRVAANSKSSSMSRLGVSKSLTNPNQQYQFVNMEPSTTGSFHCTEDDSRESLTRITEERTLEAIKNNFQCGNVQTIRRRYENSEKLSALSQTAKIGRNDKSMVASCSSTTYMSATEMPHSSTNRIFLDKSNSHLMSSAISVNELPPDMPKVELSKSSESIEENRRPREKVPLRTIDMNHSVVDTLQTKLDHTRAELQQTVEKNIAWQKYNTEREDFVRSIFMKMDHLTRENSDLKAQLESANSAPQNLSQPQRARLDKVILGLSNDLEILRERDKENRLENETLKKSTKQLSKGKKQLEHHVKQLEMEVEMEKTTKALKQENSKELQEKVKILSDNNKILAKQVEQLTQAFKNIDLARRAATVKTPNSSPPLATGPPSEHWEHENSPPDSANKYIPLTLKYPTPGSSSRQHSSGGSRESKKNRRRTTGSYGSKETTPASKSSRKAESEQYKCNFCEKPFTDYRKLLRHYDSCDNV